MQPTCALLLAAFLVPTGHDYPPEDRFWECPEGGVFQDTGCWAGSTLPDTDDTAIFDLGGAYTVQFPTGPNVRTARCLIPRGMITFEFLGTTGSYQLFGGSPDEPNLLVGAGPGDTATLDVVTPRASVFGSYFTIAGEPGSIGSVAYLPHGEAPFTSFSFGQVRLTVGDGGLGSFTAVIPATIEASFIMLGEVIVGRASTGAGQVELDGETRFTTRAWLIGEAGAASVLAHGGPTLRSDRVEMAVQPGSLADMTITGAQAPWEVFESLQVGMHGDATLVVTDGAFVFTGLSTLLGTATGSGEVRVVGPGSVLDVGGHLWNGQFGAATLEMAGGGRVTVAGDAYRITDDSLLVFTLASADDYVDDPALDVAGMTDDFAAAITLDAGYTPAPGDAFFLASADLSLGTFTLDLPSLPGGLQWEVTQDGLELRVEIAGLNIADVDGNNVVDVNDLTAVIVGWGPCPAAPASCTGDVNNDGVVNVTDLVLVIENWS